jgi:hypothetical protein
MSWADRLMVVFGLGVLLALSAGVAPRYEVFT